MRGICIAAIVAGTVSSPAFAQSLRPSYAPDGSSQTAHRVAAARVVHAHNTGTKPAANTAQARAMAQREPASASQSYAAPVTDATAPNRGLHDFFATIFAGPIMLANAFRPGQSQYSAIQSNPSLAYAPSGYATTPSQTDPRDYPVDPKFLREEVAYPGREAAGTIIVDTANKFLYLIEDGGRALRYGIGVGRPGFLWAGIKTITAKREWPDWRPPAEMIARRPDLPRFMPGGVDNPLGARALYLGSSLYRIHGSNEPWTIGTNVSSGCIRMRNEDVTDLYHRVKVGTKVVVI
jgi:lipoprotein-anchoring transpeptidase ErfK/SrfK